MNIILYTLPSCPICEMVKTKLHNKNLSYQEQDFHKIADIIQSDHAPALVIDQNGHHDILNSPSAINSWIKAQ